MPDEIKLGDFVERWNEDLSAKFWITSIGNDVGTFKGINLDSRTEYLAIQSSKCKKISFEEAFSDYFTKSISNPFSGEFMRLTQNQFEIYQRNCQDFKRAWDQIHVLEKENSEYTETIELLSEELKRTQGLYLAQIGLTEAANERANIAEVNEKLSYDYQSRKNHIERIKELEKEVETFRKKGFSAEYIRARNRKESEFNYQIKNMQSKINEKDETIRKQKILIEAMKEFIPKFEGANNG